MRLDDFVSDKVLSASAADMENETCDFQNGASAHVATADTLERARGSRKPCQREASTELPRPALDPQEKSLQNDAKAHSEETAALTCRKSPDKFNSQTRARPNFQRHWISNVGKRASVRAQQARPEVSARQGATDSPTDTDRTSKKMRRHDVGAGGTALADEAFLTPFFFPLPCRCCRLISTRINRRLG